MVRASHAELVWFRAAQVLALVVSLPALSYGGFEFYVANTLQQRADEAWSSVLKLDSGGQLSESCFAAATGANLHEWSWTDDLPRLPGPTPDSEYIQSPANGQWVQVPASPKKPPPASAAVCADYNAKIGAYRSAARAKHATEPRAHWALLGGASVLIVASVFFYGGRWILSGRLRPLWPI